MVSNKDLHVHDRTRRGQAVEDGWIHSTHREPQVNCRSILPGLALLLLIPFVANAQEGTARPVDVSPATRAAVSQEIQLTGTVTARRSAQLSVSTSGLVTALKVDVGDRVERGSILLELDAELAQYQYDAADALVTQARRALEDAQRRLEEARSLAPQRSIAETEVRSLAAEVAEDAAAVDRAMADAGYRKGILDRHKLAAPFSGVITQRAAELGEWLTPGQPVLDLVATDQMWLDFQAPEDYLDSIAVGDPVNYYLAGPDSPAHPGKVETVVPVSDAATRTFLVRVVPNADRPGGEPGLLPGLSARAELSLETGARGVTVPRDAVLRYPDGRVIVWVVEASEQGSVARERRVEPGFTFDGRIEIRSGLAPGERVVVRGNESLRSGQAVTVRRDGADR